MLTWFKHILFATLAALIGLLLIQFGTSGLPWQALGACVLAPAAVAIVYDICDAIQRGLQQLGISTTRFAIQTHLCAGLLLLLAIAISRGDPRLQGAARWVLVIGVPMTVYLYALFCIVCEHIVDKLFSSVRKPTR